jgi:Uma2 family endonuclease
MVTREPVKIERRLFTIEEYDRFIEVGVLTEDDPVELINGEVIKMSPISSPHVGCVNRLNRLFSQRAGAEVILHIQNPIHIDKYSEPEPDVVLLKYRADYYADSLPRPSDALLLIEVADTSLSYDPQVKVPLYAKAGVGEVWVVDVENRLVYVYRNPIKGKYQETIVIKPGDTIALATFLEMTVMVDEVI